MNDIADLKPARPDAGLDVQAYKAKIRWRLVLPITGLVLVFALGYWWRERRATDAFREKIYQAHASLAVVSKPYRQLRSEIEAQLLKLSKDAPKERVDERLNLSALHQGKGLYIRVPLEAIRDARAIEEAIVGQERDSIPSCLGLDPSMGKYFYQKGSFLLPNWLKRIEGSYNKITLRTAEEELKRRSKQDLDKVAEMLKSDWLLLVIQHGDNRRDAAVDVRLWDLRAKQVLLQARVQANGMLIPARNAVGSIERSGVNKVIIGKGAANDCSIATQLKELTS
ncbi:MAG: hypothetical protein IPJ88_07555 [Myxococcales bacterium]|nr:MAG: hypothetical protein IPJ88_07555 [Myxococcales bacterium]